MSFKGAVINKLDGSLNPGSTPDRVAVLIAGGVAVEGKLELDKRYELLQLQDAEDLGITEDYDSANKTPLHYNLSEIFRLSPETTVNLIVAPMATKVSDLKNDAATIAAIKSIPYVNMIALCGLTKDADINTDVTGAQLLVDRLAADYILIDGILVEGKEDYLTGTVADFQDLRALDSANVSVIIAHDPSSALPGASIGSALGMLLVRSIHENLGSVNIERKPAPRRSDSDYSLVDVKAGRWIAPQLVMGAPFDTLSYADQKKLDELGYIYAGSFAGYTGVFFSDSHTCTAMTSDYCRIERNAVWNKAARRVRNILIPQIRSVVPADPETGYIADTTLSYWKSLIEGQLEPMRTAGDVSGYDIYIDPKQEAVTEEPFKVRLQLVANGIVHEFDVDLGFTKSV